MGKCLILPIHAGMLLPYEIKKDLLWNENMFVKEKKQFYPKERLKRVRERKGKHRTKSEGKKTVKSLGKKP